MRAEPSGGRSAAVVEAFVRRCRTEILAEWKRAARAIPAAKQLSAVVLLDHMPELLDQLAELADAIVDHGWTDERFETARRHALDRLADGFDVTAVVAELSLLRGCIWNVWSRENPGAPQTELRAINLAIDRAIAVSVGRYAEARDRAMAAIDRISTASLESKDLDDLLARLLQVFMETTPAVDTVAILLVEDGGLRVRAVAGLEQDLARDSSIAIGEGFTGGIAAERRPRSVRGAYLDPVVRNELVQDKPVHALYGIPLIQGDELIGVARMGSLTADEFSEDDRQCFSSMASRATVGIRHHVLRRKLDVIIRERERALAKLESLLAASPIAIGFVDRDLRYLRVNDALAALSDRPARDHIGRTVSEVPSEHAAALETVLREVLETGQPSLNRPVTRADGRSLLANLFPVRSSAGEVMGVGAIVVDVTDEKRAQDELRVEQARLQSILDHAPLAIWVKDTDGRILLANERLSEALGISLDRLVGHRSIDVLPPDIGQEHEAHDRVVLDEHRSLEVEESVPSPHGVRTFLSIKFPIPSEPPLIGAIATEITERKRMEDELRAAVRTREELLAIVSHDLRNPLGTVQLSVATLQAQQPADHRTRRHLEMIDRASQRMETLIDDLLDIASIRAGRLVLDSRREPADAVVNEAVDLQHPIATEKSVELKRDTDVAGIEVMCDRDRVLQVFGNLIGNAVKFCRPGDTITVAAQRANTDVQFSVSDTGPGIQPDVIPHLFDAYWSGAEHRAIGSGLGLYICRGIVESHGGRIWVESTPGEGARFLFTLPIAR